MPGSVTFWMQLKHELLLDSVLRHHKLPTAIETICDANSSITFEDKRTSLFAYSDFHQFRRVDEGSSFGGTSPVSAPEYVREKQCHSTPPTTRVSRKESSPEKMEALMFTDSFDKYAPGEEERLEALYKESQGERITKRKIKAFSDELGIAQCKIRRFFGRKATKKDDRSQQATGLSTPILSGQQYVLAPQYVPIYPKPPVDPEAVQLLEELEDNVDQLEGLNQQISSLIVGMINSA